MTPAELQEIVATGDAARLAEAVAPLTEKERRGLSRTAWELRRDLEKQYWKAFDGRREEGILPRLARGTRGRTRDELWELVVAAELAMLAVCPLSRVRRLREHPNAATLKILCDRKPDWLDQWVEERLESEWPGIQWKTMRELMKAGAAKKPSTDGYLRLMVQGLPDRWGPRIKHYSSLSRKLLAEPDLLEDEVWRLFEVETQAFSLDYGEDNPHAPPDYESWSTAVLRLAAEGEIDRRKLLDATLSGLTTGFKNTTLSGYIKLHEGLKPSLDELSVRQDTYLELLASQASHVVTFALRMLKALEKGKRLDGPGLLEAVGRVFDLRTKTQPKAALGLIERVVKREPDLTAAAARLAAEALLHESPDVQGRALKLLAGWAERMAPALVSLLEERSDHVAAAHRARLEELIARLGGTSPPAGDESEDVADNDVYEAELLERAASLSPGARARAGVEAAVRSLEDGVPLEPLELDLLDAAVLPRARPVEPIASVDELIDAVAHAVEVVDSATEVERILDGISRLADERPEDFERRTTPLLKRIDRGGGSETSRGLLSSWGMPAGLHCVVVAWLRRAKPRLIAGPYRTENGARRAITGRLIELAGRVRRGVAAPLLAAPTHAHGWIDPGRLVERILELQESRLDVPRLDLIQALLRLAPDGRRKARLEAGAIEGNVGRMVRWALGGDEEPTRRDRRDAPLWVAAGRSRSPRRRLEELVVLRVHEEIPDALTPAGYSWTAWTEARTYRDVRGERAHCVPRLKLESQPRRMKGVEPAEFPCAALHVRASRFSVHDVHSPWLLEWVSMLWPLNLDAFFAAGARSIADRIDMEASSFEPDSTYLEPLLEAARPWSEMAILVEWLGLASREVDARRAAIDALLEGIQDGRAHPERLVPVLMRLQAGGWLKLNRLAGALQEVARVSPIACWFVATTLDAVVASLDTIPRDVHHVLSLLLEVLTELGLGVSDRARAVLGGVKGSSKTARLAKALLELRSRPGSCAARRAMLEALEGRIVRAGKGGLTCARIG